MRTMFANPRDGYDVREAIETVMQYLTEDVVAWARHRIEQAILGGLPDTSKLTPRRREVLAWLLDGHPTIVIADRLGISPETVRGHIGAIYRHFEVHTRAELMAMWVRRPEDEFDQGPTLPVGWGEGWLGQE